MNNFILFVFGLLMLSAIAVLAIIRRAYQKPEPPKQLMFLGYQNIDICGQCKELLTTYNQCLCGCPSRETVVAIRRTFTDFTVEFEVIEVDKETNQVI